MEANEKKLWLDLACAVVAVDHPGGFRNLVRAVAALPVNDEIVVDLLDHVINLRAADPKEIGDTLEEELRNQGVEIPS